MKYILASISILFLCIKTAHAVPKITILNSQQQVNKNEQFNVTFDVSLDTPSSDTYYTKGRIGSSSASLNQGETFNPVTNNWLSDTTSWNNFPILSFSNSLIATSSMTLRTKSSAISGNNLLIIRMNKNSTSYDSSATTLLVLDSLPTSAPISIPTSIETSAPSPTDLPTPTPISYTNIFISEIMVNPPSGGNEWIELFNNNDFSVFLMNWYIDDIENGGSSPKLFSLEIPPKNYGSFELSNSMFNNTGDSIRLLDFNKNLIDSFEYSGTTQGKTLGRTSIDSDNFCLQESTRNSINTSCINTVYTSIPSPSKSLTSPTEKLTQAINSFLKPSLTKTVINELIKSQNINVPVGDILGSHIVHQQTNHPIIYLSFLSFSYSLLTIFSVFLKMKREI